MAGRHIQAYRRRERSRRKDQFRGCHHGNLSIAPLPARQTTNTGGRSFFPHMPGFPRCGAVMTVGKVARFVGKVLMTQ